MDLDTRHVLDLLPDRQGPTLAAWLREHPSIEVVMRDRSTDDTAAVTSVLPEAVRVADRWHLLANPRDMLERYLLGVHRRLRQLPPLDHERKGAGRTRSFGLSLSRDRDAVRAALSLSWSNAQAEGQITKLKAIKRAMVGLAGFDLLRRRVLLS